ncbi:hypothetical protein OPQ81_006735 [Rhizoctonia solani]|nr:hypothetical protein OPQ81_006735 [Rhizoctonia solani]
MDDNLNSFRTLLLRRCLFWPGAALLDLVFDNVDEPNGPVFPMPSVARGSNFGDILHDDRVAWEPSCLQRVTRFVDDVGKPNRIGGPGTS